MELKKFEKPEYYVNRELSWLKFDDRVLSEARDKSLPLFERLKFLSITSSNLDEFYMVRVASLKDQVHAGYEKTDIAGLTPKEQLREISVQTHELVHVQYNTLNRSLIPALEKAGLHMIMEHENLSEKQKEFADRYFEDNVYPVLTPMAMDSSRPFPLIRNKSLNIGALISKKTRKRAGRYWNLRLFRYLPYCRVSLRSHPAGRALLRSSFWRKSSREISESCF